VLAKAQSRRFRPAATTSDAGGSSGDGSGGGDGMAAMLNGSSGMFGSPKKMLDLTAVSVLSNKNMCNLQR